MYQAKIEPYLKAWRTIFELQGAGKNSPIESLEGRSQEGILDKIYELTRNLRDQTDDPDCIGFLPFPRTLALREEFLAFASELEGWLVEEEQKSQPQGSVTTVLKLGKERRRKLQDLAARFNNLFNGEVTKRPIFISSENNELLKYLSPETWLRPIDPEAYQFLPRLARTHFHDGGQCLAYGLYHAALGLALQAVEATLRYFFNRHQGDSKHRMWHNMLEWLNDEKLLPAGDCYHILSELKNEYRNLVAHGRAYRGINSPYDAEEIFKKCWKAVRMLMFEAPNHPCLRLKIIVPPDFDFDTALATYLFYWNSELPQVGPEVILFNDELFKKKTIIDSTLKPEVKLVPTLGKSLSEAVSEHLRIEEKNKSILQPLLSFVADRCNGITSSGFRLGKPETVDLMDLFTGIRLHKTNSAEAMNETWIMLDKFLNKPWLGTGADKRLISDLEQQLAYEALNTNFLKTEIL